MGWAGCPTARYQNWSDFTTLLAPTSQDGANEIRRPFWARSCGAGGGSVAQVGQARLAAVRQAFNHLFLPSSFILTLRRPERADQEGYCCLCDGGGQGAVAHLNGGYWRGLSDRVAVLLLIKCAFFLL